MLKQATFQNFTTVPNDDWRFVAGLNVIIGENGLGKSHVLKALYALLKAQQVAPGVELTKTLLEKAYADKLLAVMRPESLGRLVKRRQGRGRCEISLQMSQDVGGCKIAFASNAKSQVEVIQAPSSSLEKSPVYFPTRELVTLCPWFLPLYDNYHLEFEETWRDTVSLLGAPAVKGPRETVVAELVQPLEEAMGGKVVVDNVSGRFYLQMPGEGKMEMPLVAEGLRKIAMLARLISTGVLLEQGYLFWDEPETNLNPKLIKVIARCIMNLCGQGIQVFLATHSYFLLKELELLSRTVTVEKHYISLTRPEGSQEIVLQQSASLLELDNIVALDEELAQYDREMQGAGGD